MTYEMTPDDIQQFNQNLATSNNNAPSQPPFDQRFATAAAKGFGNNIINSVDMLPGVNIPTFQQQPDLASKAGNIAGNIGGFVAGGEGLRGIGLAAEGLPYLGDAASYLANSKLGQQVGRTAYSGLYGASQDTNNRLAGLGAGLGFGTLSEALPYAIQGVSGLADKYFGANDIKNQIVNGISQGNSLEDNSKNFAQTVFKTANDAYDQGQKQFQDVFDQVPNESIYSPGQAPQYANFTPKKGVAYLTGGQISGNNALPQNVLNSALSNSKVSSLHNNFMNNPTLQNAHLLQSQMGARMRAIDNGNTSDVISSNERDSLQQAQSALRSDMGTYLGAQGNQGLAQDYQAAQANWKNNVVPWTENDVFKNMATPLYGPPGNIVAKGKVPTDDNPGNLSTLFKNPTSQTQQLLSNLPPSASDSILYSQLGKQSAQATPESLLAAKAKLDEQGLGSFLSPERQAQFGQLQNAVNRQNLAKTVVSTVGGGVLGSLLGGGEEAGGAIGSILGHQLAPMLFKSRPSTSQALAQTHVGQKVYNSIPYLRQAFLASKLGNYSQ
ncbi:MAG TPA: hypothetical protein VHZ76_00660 [Gammaproteobacteria bacterium]|jgi:hypothetical protein|nr:hypothetical protein [Gammaproteobacteria bacterium]